MPSPLSMDLRKRAVKAYENGEGTLSEIAERFDISVSSLTSWRALIRSGEGLEPRPHSGGKHHQKIFAEHEKALQDWLEESPDLRLTTLSALLKEHHEVEIDPSQLSRVLKRMGYTRKKRQGSAWLRTAPETKQSEDTGNGSSPAS